MMGKAVGRASKLFYTGFNLEERVPAEHPLRRVAEAIDFRFVRARVAGRYGVNGNESVDPTLILKLLFLAFHENVRGERELMRQLPLRLDWMWFCGLDLDSDIPDHSVLSKARRRWGLEVFEAVFARVLDQCVQAGLVEGKTVYADSTVLKADASVESRVPRTLWRQLEQGLDRPGEHDDGPSSAPPSSASGSAPARTPPPPEDTQELPAPPVGKFNAGSVSATDPDAATTRRRGRGVVLGYRDHCLVDGRRGVVVATIATPADYDDSTMLTPLLDKRSAYLGDDPDNAVADSAYGTMENVAKMRERGIRPYLKPRPGSKGLGGWLERMPEECDPEVTLRLMRRRLHTAEGRFAEAHVRHDHRRCRWRRRWRVQVQCYLVAAVQNIKKLVKWTSPKAAAARAACLWSLLNVGPHPRHPRVLAPEPALAVATIL
ncbi:MAG: transposase [Terriglobales bacterium]